VKPNTKAIRPVAATGSAARPEHRPGGGEDQPADGKRAASPGAADAAQHEQLGKHDEGGVDGERQGYDTRRHVRFD
jgi:hypothetical protein